METYSTTENLIMYSPLGTTEWFSDIAGNQIERKNHLYLDGNWSDDIIIHPDEMIFPDANWDNDVVDLTDIEQNFIPDEYGITPIFVAKKSTYTQAHRKAQQKYREKFPEKYCEIQRKLYDDKKKDEEWKKKFNERSKVNNKKYREKKNKEILEAGGEIKKRGRPRKVKGEVVAQEEVKIQNLELEAPPSNNNNFCVRCENFVAEPLDMGYCKLCSKSVLKECEEDSKKCLDEDTDPIIKKLIKKKILKKKDLIV